MNLILEPLYSRNEKLNEFQSFYNLYIEKLPFPQQGPALWELNNVMTNYEASITRYKVTLDDQEMQVTLNMEVPRTEQSTSGRVVEPEVRPSRRVFLERTKLPIFSGKGAE